MLFSDVKSSNKLKEQQQNPKNHKKNFFKKQYDILTFTKAFGEKIPPKFRNVTIQNLPHQRHLQSIFFTQFWYQLYIFLIKEKEKKWLTGLKLTH